MSFQLAESVTDWTDDVNDELVLIENSVSEYTSKQSLKTVWKLLYFYYTARYLLDGIYFNR